MKNNTSKVVTIGGVTILILVLVSAVYIYTRQDNDDGPDSAPPASTSESAETDSSSSTISKAQAEQIATDAYGGTVKETENDDYKGTPAWEVEINDSKKGRIEIKVDKQTGDILDYEQD